MISRIFIFLFVLVVYSGSLKPQMEYGLLNDPMFLGMVAFALVCLLYIYRLLFSRLRDRKVPIKALCVRLTPIVYLIPLLFSIWFSSFINAEFLGRGFNPYGTQKLIRFTFLTVPMCIVLPIIARKVEDIYYYYYGLIALGIIVVAITLYTLNPIGLGMGRYMTSGEIMGAAILVLLPIMTSRGVPLPKRLVSICICATIVPAMLITTARGPIIGVCTIALANIWTSSMKSRLLQIGFLALIVLLVIYPLYEQIRGTIAMKRMVRRFGVIMVDEGGGRLGRISRGVELFADHPVFGVGAGWYADGQGRDYPHNAFIEVLCEFGIPGAIAYIYALIGGLWALWTIKTFFRRTDNSIFYITTAYLWLYTFLMSMKSGDINDNRAFWIINALCIYISHRVARKRMHLGMKQAFAEVKRIGS